eukprot:11696309-Alexandrium_andersonii.AAC.1
MCSRSPERAPVLTRRTRAATRVLRDVPHVRAPATWAMRQCTWCTACLHIHAPCDSRGTCSPWRNA